jgi:hypothetical protein
VKVEKNLDQEEVDLKLPERCLYLEETEVSSLADFFSRAHSLFPDLPLKMLEIELAPDARIFCFTPSPKEQLLLSVLTTLTPAETEFMSLIRAL